MISILPDHFEGPHRLFPKGKHAQKRFFARLAFLLTAVFCVSALVSVVQGGERTICSPCFALPKAFLVPMDDSQTEHCRAYGLVYRALLNKSPDISWLLNFRGGSFLLPSTADIASDASSCGVKLEAIDAVELSGILTEISEENMDVVPLEIAPRIAIYLRGGEAHQGDVVARTLEYAKIPFKTLYDGEILDGKLASVDWLHIHHKDFTGQGHKAGVDAFDRELTAGRHFAKPWQMKQAVSATIRGWVSGGGFLFAMCSAAETLDISLAAQDVDIVPSSWDGDPPDPDFERKLDFTKSMAFGNFTVTPSGHHYSDIDIPSAGEGTTFSLFGFSAQVDAIPTLLNQNHVNEIQGFSGETTSFRKSLVKKDVTILAENNDGVSVRYLCGTVGKGVFCYYGGHAPGPMNRGDFKQFAPAYRLILNNVLFPSAKIKKRKT
ncbi:MAG: asparagine synthetase B [Candidatus Ozemobacteraceae bacterium]